MGGRKAGPAPRRSSLFGLTFGAAALLAALAGCETPAYYMADTTPPIATGKNGGEVRGQGSGRFQAPSTPEGSGFEATAMTELARYAPGATSIDDDPQKLLGLDRSSLSSLLGRPKMVRRERPAEIWQYLGTDCVFDVFLYEEGGAYRVVHSEARDAAAVRTEARACLGQLLRTRLSEPVG